MAQKLSVGLFGVGLDTYWDQFDGLLDRLNGYMGIVEEMIESPKINLHNLGMVDNYEKAVEAGRRFRQMEVDLLFIHVTTYALSSTVLTVLQKCPVPVVLLNLSPLSQIDYKSFNQLNDRTKMTGEWLAHCAACPVPEMISVIKRAGFQYAQITGVLKGDSDHVRKEISEWVEAAHVKFIMSNNRLGLFGNYYGGMLDIYTDLTQQLIQFGGHFEILEVDLITQIRRFISEEAIAERIILFKSTFDVQKDCRHEDLVSAAKTSLALEQIVHDYKLGSIAYYHKGTGTENEETIASIILGNSILSGNNVPVAGEYEVKNVQAMKVLDTFGVVGSFTEYYGMDHVDDVVLMGHDGPGHIRISEGKVSVKPLEVYHGKVSRGLSVEMSVKNGPVTLLSVVQKPNAKLMLLTASAESVSGPILEIGNTNSRYKFPISAIEFMETWNSYGPAHHCAIGTGDITSKIEKLGQLLNIEVVQVC
ncbi:hypothetical protein JM658_11570 [Joostella atrarenae]|uniref:Arabinose isomerase n=1 Tax=Joostella atrarenae TaxID=679257 RepID=A0ABS9J4W2_9FLAO|nr:hypothetical protein [Joostella atrarenae]MCF8715466.1 hypothetical protein [Joostella atrarenae]